VKKLWIIILLVIVLLAGGCSQFTYRVTVKSRDLSFGVNDPNGFAISPAQVRVGNLKVGQSVTISVKIINKGTAMNYEVYTEQPTSYVKGYGVPNDDYGYTVSSNKIEVESGQTATVTFTITREVISANKQEKGFVIVQDPLNTEQVNLIHAEIFEMLLP
jgi:hypothetical protein